MAPLEPVYWDQYLQAVLTDLGHPTPIEWPGWAPMTPYIPSMTELGQPVRTAPNTPYLDGYLNHYKAAYRRDSLLESLGGLSIENMIESSIRECAKMIDEEARKDRAYLALDNYARVIVRPIGSCGSCSGPD